VLVVSELLEKRGTIPPGSVTLEEGEALLFSDASLVIWYSWNLFLFGWLDWWALAVVLLVFADLPVYKFYEYKCNRVLLKF